MSSVDDLVREVRAAGDAADGGAADATRLRVRRSLEVDAKGRRQFASVATGIAILCGGTMAWALATGQVERVWGPVQQVVTEEPAVAAPVVHAKPRAAAPVVPASAPGVPDLAAAPVAPAAAPPAPASAPSIAIRTAPRAPIAAPAPAPLLPAPPVADLYRRAHDLHFHGTDHAATLAAWDAYLAAEPDGRFAAEARYNRALVLIRLARYSDAREALQPFARGEVGAAYRQPEAQALVERLAQYE